MTHCPLCHRSDLPLLLIGMLFCCLIAALLVGHGAMEGVRVEFEGKLREQANRQASLVIQGATYATVHNHNGEWIVTPEPIDTTPPKTNNKKGEKK
jgi:hypothetical protein